MVNSITHVLLQPFSLFTSLLIFSGIKPKNKDWCTDDCTRFQQLTVGKQFASQIRAINSTEENKYELELQLIDVSTDDDVCLNKILIAEGRCDQ